MPRTTASRLIRIVQGPSGIGPVQGDDSPPHSKTAPALQCTALRPRRVAALRLQFGQALQRKAQAPRNVAQARLRYAQVQHRRSAPRTLHHGRNSIAGWRIVAASERNRELHRRLFELGACSLKVRLRAFKADSRNIELDRPTWRPTAPPSRRSYALSMSTGAP